VPASAPPPPLWLETLPLVGPQATRLWQTVAAMGVEELSAKFMPYSGTVIRWLLARAGSAGLMFVQFLLTVTFAAILYRTGERWAAGIIGFSRRLAGDRGESSVRLAGHAIRGVALGVVLTAILQSIVAGIGLAICGVPYAVALTVAMFVLAIAQIGPAPVLVPAVIWMYWTGAFAWATVLLLWSLVALSFDNFLRPILIKRSADLPLLLIFVGVIGGLLAFGLIGIFVGPVVLAVAFTLLQAWIKGDPSTVRQEPTGGL
jgi:predicted PurR-regulated permease PerM